MSRLNKRFADLLASGKKALIPYVTAGDPNPAVTVPLMHAMVEAGSDIIEIGVPFSDPMADGPVIQQACERALEHNVSLTDVLGMVATFREADQETPIVLMGYLNPVEVMGYEVFAKKAATAGVDGVLTVDLPPEEAEDLITAFEANQLDPIFLVSPESTVDRFKQITKYSRGFLYYVSLKGVTGVKRIDTEAVAQKMAELRDFTDLPICVGFGINDAETAATISQIANGVVVGSAVVKRIAEHKGDQSKIIEEVKSFLAGLRSAIDAN
ncbi:MAG: tryptophan synthase subunit alpha [Gammaproteobacteria bacterium]|nr:tryptophan synthase subunit alpha [Gammaproteobacteria bacterium]